MTNVLRNIATVGWAAAGWVDKIILIGSVALAAIDFALGSIAAGISALSFGGLYLIMLYWRGTALAWQAKSETERAEKQINDYTIALSPSARAHIADTERRAEFDRFRLFGR